MSRYLVPFILWLVFTCLPAYAAEVETLAPVEARADEVLREMSAFLGGLSGMTFHAETSSDEVLDSGQQIQLSEGVEIAVRRPDRFMAKSEGDLGAQQLFYDGTSVTLFDMNEKLYATIDAPATIDAALDHALEAFELKAPLAELLYSDIHARVTAAIQSGLYLGLHRVQGTDCHHLAFRTREVDWQLWVEAGDKPWPRKVVITAKRLAGAPQFTALLSDWSVKRAKDGQFEFTPPKGAEKIEFLPAGN